MNFFNQLKELARDFLESLESKFITRIKNGYLQFFDFVKKQWEWVHRKVAEIMTDEKIPKGFEVHHKNRAKLDNDPENLEVLSKEEHRAIHNQQSKTETPQVSNRLNKVIKLESIKIQDFFNTFKSSGLASCSCPRCGGGGYLPEFSHVAGGICFLCGGDGDVGSSDFEEFEPYDHFSEEDDWDNFNFDPYDDFDDRFDPLIDGPNDFDPNEDNFDDRYDPLDDPNDGPFDDPLDDGPDEFDSYDDPYGGGYDDYGDDYH